MGNSVPGVQNLSVRRVLDLPWKSHSIISDPRALTHQLLRQGTVEILLWHHDFCARKLYPKVVIGQASFLFLSFTLRRTAGGQNYSYMEDVPFIISLRTKLLLRQDIPKMF